MLPSGIEAAGLRLPCAAPQRNAMTSKLESLCHQVLQQLAAEPHFVQQLASEPQFVQQLLARIQAPHGEGADGPGGQAQVLLEAAEERHIRVHLGDGEADTPREAAFSLRLFGGPGDSRAHSESGAAVCELDATVAVEVLIPPDGGQIHYQGHALSGGLQTSPGSSEWRDGVVNYFRFDAGGRQHLLISAAASTVFLQDWRNADLGIRLRDADASVAALARYHASMQGERVASPLAAANGVEDES